MLVKSSIEEFNRILGSSSPAPGGGSVAALSGALGASLVSMVCNLSIGKEEYETFENLLKESLEKAQSLSNSLLERVDLDTEAFNGVMAAFKMPKETEEDKSARRDAIQEGFKKAVRSPLGIAVECLEVLKLAEKLIGKFNTNAISDLGVGAQQAHAGLEGAVMNVRINLPSIKDEKFVAETNLKVVALLEEGGAIRSKVYTYVQENIG
ncbi:MAG: cyclodeaminase/cyclohydrolase family protein [Desulfitobacterium hafniense]|nr:cyclodeaminase/cyclohydrolase family protein [Desulfitobacterium hafniense]